jgi:hypothetical protein
MMIFTTSTPRAKSVLHWPVGPGLDPGADKGPVCFGFWQLLATKSCCGLPNAQLFSQFL